MMLNHSGQWWNHDAYPGSSAEDGRTDIHRSWGQVRSIAFN